MSREKPNTLRRFAAAVGQDIAFAIRTFGKNPGFTTTAILTLALGIGANVALFSVLYAVVLKPLPFADPDRLILIQAETAVAGTRRPLSMSVYLRDFDAWKGAHTFERPALYTRASHGLSTSEGTELLDDALVSTEFFSTMGGPLVAGRPLSAADDAMPTCVVSERLANRLFHMPDRAVGQVLTLNSRAFTIIGVAAREFRFPERTTDAWISARFVRTFDSRDFGFQMIARARDGVTIERLNSEVESIARSQPQASGELRGRVVRLSDQITAPVARTLAVLFAAVTLLLLVACINLANLMLARNASRAREIAIRASLGASRARLLGQALTESACLAFLGAAAGIAVAYLLIMLAVDTAGAFVLNLESARLNVPTLLFAALVMIVAALAAGAAPAVVAAWSTNDPRIVVTVSSTRPHQRIRQILCGIEWAVAFVLLVGATLLSRSLVRLMNVDLGVATDHVVTASLNFALGHDPNEADVIRRVGQLLERINAIPGVRISGVGTSLPPQMSRIRMTLRREDRGVDYAAVAVAVSPSYFSSLRIPLVQGRFFNASDDASHPDVIIMSEDTARRFFGSGDIIGQTLSVPRGSWRMVRKPPATMTLVGVIGNVKYSGLTTPPDDAIYRPFAQEPWIAPFLVARTTGDPASVLPSIRREIASTDPVVVSQVQTLDSILSDVTAQPRMQTVVFAVLAGLALAMASVGLFSVVAFSFAQRTTEIGIRRALGASRGQVLTLMAREGVRIGVVGLLAGVGAALALARLFAASLYGIAPIDPLSFIAAGAALLFVAIVASYLPARRAVRLDPLIALRHD